MAKDVDISLTQKSATGEIILEAYPKKGVIGVVHNNRCEAIFSLVDLWDFTMKAMLAIEHTENSGVLRRCKEAQAVLQWRKDNL